MCFVLDEILKNKIYLNHHMYKKYFIKVGVCMIY